MALRQLPKPLPARTTVYFDSRDQLEQFQALMHRTGRTVSGYFRQRVREELEKESRQ